MKKLAAIFLLLLLSFNFMGYRLWFYFVQQQADERMISQLDADRYNEADLLTLKIPLQMPYQPSQKDFERVDGEINVDGIIYKYVKRKVEDGQLVLLCLPDNHKMQLEKASHSFYKLTNDLPVQSGKSDNAKLNFFKSLLVEFTSHPAAWTFTAPADNTTYLFPSNEFLPTLLFSHTPEQPPDLLIA